MCTSLLCVLDGDLFTAFAQYTIMQMLHDRRDVVVYGITATTHFKCLSRSDVVTVVSLHGIGRVC